MRRFSLLWAVLLLWSAVLSAQTTIYWKKDHIYGTPGGGRIATAVPEPDDTTVPSTPTNLAYGTVTPTTVALSWNASTDSGGSGLAGYKVYRGPIPVGTTTNTTFTDEGLVPQTGYVYTIRAFDKDQNHSAASGSVSPTTTSASGDATDPSVPEGLMGVSPDDDTVELSWNASTDEGGSGVAGYKVYRDTTLVSGGTPVATTSFTDTGLDPHTEYTYEVRAVDGQGNESDDSDPLDVTTRGIVVLTDDFNRADTTLTGGSWMALGSETSFLVRHNQAVAEPPVSGWEWKNSVVTTSVSDFYAAIDLLNHTSVKPGLIFWGSATGGRYRVYVETNWVVLRYHSGPSDTTGTHVTSGLITAPFLPGRLEIEADSSTRNIRISYRGTEVIDFTETDTSRPNSGYAGPTARNYYTYYEGDAVVDDFRLEEW